MKHTRVRSHLSLNAPPGLRPGGRPSKVYAQASSSAPTASSAALSLPARLAPWSPSLVVFSCALSSGLNSKISATTAKQTSVGYFSRSVSSGRIYNHNQSLLQHPSLGIELRSALLLCLLVASPYRGILARPDQQCGGDIVRREQLQLHAAQVRCTASIFSEHP